MALNWGAGHSVALPFREFNMGRVDGTGQTDIQYMFGEIDVKYPCNFLLLDCPNIC